MTSFACVDSCPDGFFYTGGSNSDVYKWSAEERKCLGSVNAHSKGFVSSITFHEGKLYSGGKDGKIVITSVDLAKEGEIDFGVLVRAISIKNGNMLVGTRDGCITECGLDGSGKNVVMYSHSDGEVWGLSIYPNGNAVTSGDDNQVLWWNPNERKRECHCAVSTRKVHVKRGASTLSRLPASQCSRAVAISEHHEGVVAVATNDGHVEVKNKDGQLADFSDSKEWIEAMAFSPDGAYLAVGSHDNNIYVYETSNWSLHGTCKAHNSFITALDWCCESKYIRSNCGAYELLFFDVSNNCEQDKDGRSNTTGTEWATHTVKISWSTEGVFPKGQDGTHINGVALSADKNILATGDDWGLVRLFRFPVRNGGRPVSYAGHSEHVVRVGFSCDDTYLWSIGGYDQTVMQWKRC